MPALVEIDTDELHGLALALEVDRKTMEAAIRVAANRAIAWARVQVARGMSQRLGIRESSIAKRLKERKANSSSKKASVWIALNPLNAERANPKKTPTGLKAGNQEFRGAFLAHGKYGGGLVAMRRKGKARKPLEGASFDILAIAPAMLTRGTWPGLNERFLAFYKEELERKA